MAQRSDPSADVPLTPQELADVRKRYAMLSDSGLQQAYSEALARCRLDYAVTLSPAARAKLAANLAKARAAKAAQAARA